jgi:hypothetical protein
VTAPLSFAPQLHSTLAQFPRARYTVLAKDPLSPRSDVLARNWNRPERLRLQARNNTTFPSIKPDIANHSDPSSRSSPAFFSTQTFLALEFFDIARLNRALPLSISTGSPHSFTP